MQFRKTGRMALATALLLAIVPVLAAENPEITAQNGTTSHPQSVFVAPDQDLAFGLTVPNDSTTDLYFTLAVQASFSWGAVGLGNDHMVGSLILMVYANARGDNVTFSPRLASKHAEPVYSPAIHVDALEGTGLVNGTYVFSGLCHNCRDWVSESGSYNLDVSRTDQPCIYALGSGPSVSSDDPAAPLRFHSDYGSFSIDMLAAAGPLSSGAPVLDANDTQADTGSVLLSSATGKQDWAAIFHALIMVFCFIGLLPLGVLFLRIGEWVRVHGANQTLALVLVIVGAGLGISISTKYNRAAHFNNPHQVLGLIVVCFIVIQFTLGVCHHHIFKQTQRPTKLAPFHIWLGRLTILLGVINGFLGFPFAQAPRYNYILAGLVLAIVPIVGFMLIFKNVMRRLRRRRDEDNNDASGGYDPEPWRNDVPPSQAGGGGDHPPRYEEATLAGGPAIGLSTFSSQEQLPKDRGRRGGGTAVTTAELGAQHAPREYV